MVLSENAAPVRSLWAVYSGDDLEDAKTALCQREGIPLKSLEKKIGAWSRGQDAPSLTIELDEWAKSRGIDSVVWTALPAKFNGNDGEEPTTEAAINYLKSLRNSARDVAEEYIRKAPKQIDTAIRGAIEAELGWSCVSET